MNLRDILKIFLFISINIFFSGYMHSKSCLSVAAAGDLCKVLDDVKRCFENKYSDIELKFSFGSSGNLTSQIQQGAPYDIFLSADEWFPEQLLKAGLVDDSGVFLYTIGCLALWVRNDLDINPANIDWHTLFDKKIVSIVIANPKVAPYGKAAESSLYNANYYHSLKHKLVFADNVAQAAQFLYAGSAEAGIISYSHANSLKNGLVWMIPKCFYPKLRQAGVILKTSQCKQQANLLRSFLLSYDGQLIFKRYGFGKI